MVSQILTTKLYIPLLKTGVVLRPRLIEILNKGLYSKLILVSASAGFGKTMLLSEWITQSKISAAWLSLDEEHRDFTQFFTYIVAALQTISEDIGNGVSDLLQSSKQPPMESVLTILINEIDKVKTNFILVLDDYHLIDNKTIDTAITFLLKHQPPQMTLVIATREDPNLPLARLRGRSQMTELRVIDLRFTSSETAEFLNGTMSQNLPEKEIMLLAARTEGWITGLQLAAVSMEGRNNISGFIKSFTGSHRFVLDYLVEEVLNQQSESIQIFLLHTSILDRLCGPLCDALLLDNTASGKKTLEYLEHANLLLIPLDDNRIWYRYHHLFSDVLQAHLLEKQPSHLKVLHLRASMWYEQKDLPSDAIRHALAAEDYERAANLAELAWPAMSVSFQSITWLGWLNTLPDELVKVRPVLSLGYAWALLNSGKLEAADIRLQDVERCLETVNDGSDKIENAADTMVIADGGQFKSLPISLATARAYHAQAVNNPARTVKYARQAITLLPEEEVVQRSTVNALLGLALWASGDLTTAFSTFLDGLTGMPPLGMITGTFVLADLKITLGNLHEAVSIYKNSLKLAMDQGDPKPIGTEDLYIGISGLHREQGHLTSAAQDLLTARELGEQIELPDWQYRWYTAQARLLETNGDLDGALHMLDEAERVFVRTPLPVVHPIEALKARVWLKQGRINDALNWVHTFDLTINDELSFLKEFEHITLIRLLITLHRENPADHSIEQALQLAERLLQAAEEGERKGSTIEILVLKALAHDALGSTSHALNSLQQAMELAEPEDYVHIFVDEGPPMALLLNKAASHGIMPGYSKRLLAQFEDEEKKNREKSFLFPDQPISERLSQRELEVLHLIADGLSNREIGEKLFIALDTVKGHNRRIFGKLDVVKRAQAIKKARSLNILPRQ